MKNDELFVEVEEIYKNNNVDLLYNRERRLEKAPEAVRLLHSPTYIKRRSFLDSIWSNRGHRFIFIAILILVFLNLSFFFYYYRFDTGKINGIRVEMDTFQYGNELLVNIVLGESENTLQKIVKAYTKAFNSDGEEVSFAEVQGIYLGHKLILHFKIENKNIKKVETIVYMDEKILSLSKKI